MSTPAHIKRADGRTCFEKAWLMETFRERARGLIGRRPLEEGCAWVFESCDSIHTMFMSVDIDVIQVDEEGVVLDVVRALPWRLVRMKGRTEHVIETAANGAAAAGITPGTVLTWR